MNGYVIASQGLKGGGHKTTVCTNLAFEAARNGHKVLLVDTDTGQRSSTLWYEGIESRENIDLISIDSGIDNLIKSVKKDYDFIFVDGAPRVNRMTAQTVKSADLVIMPVQESPYDIWASGELLGLIKDRQAITDGLQPIAYFVRSGCRAGSVMGRQMNDVLREFEIPMMQSTITKLDAYVYSAFGQGVTAPDWDQDADNEKASFEIKKLFKEVLTLLG